MHFTRLKSRLNCRTILSAKVNLGRRIVMNHKNDGCSYQYATHIYFSKDRLGPADRHLELKSNLADVGLIVIKFYVFDYRAHTWPLRSMMQAMFPMYLVARLTIWRENIGERQATIILHGSPIMLSPAHRAHATSNTAGCNLANVMFIGYIHSFHTRRTLRERPHGTFYSALPIVLHAKSRI